MTPEIFWSINRFDSCFFNSTSCLKRALSSEFFFPLTLWKTIDRLLWPLFTFLATFWGMVFSLSALSYLLFPISIHLPTFVAVATTVASLTLRDSEWLSTIGSCKSIDYEHIWGKSTLIRASTERVLFDVPQYSFYQHSSLQWIRIASCSRPKSATTRNYFWCTVWDQRALDSWTFWQTIICTHLFACHFP